MSKIQDAQRTKQTMDSVDATEAAIELMDAGCFYRPSSRGIWPSSIRAVAVHSMPLR